MNDAGTNYTPDRSRDLKLMGHAVPVLCREEALVYIENFLRGDRTEPDLVALADFLRLLPEDETATFPFDPQFILQQVMNELAALESR